MTKQKDMGEMGFRDLWDLNSEMLMKMAWRLHDEQKSIWAEVLKGLYFPRGEFMNAKKGASPSWAWENILTGRDVLRTHEV